MSKSRSKKARLSRRRKTSKSNKCKEYMEHVRAAINPCLFVEENDGTELVASNYWGSDMAQKGFFFLSINAGAFRLLVPENQEKLIEEFKTGEYSIISKGPNLESLNFLNPFTCELLFEDHTITPYMLWINASQVSRYLLDEDDGKKFKLSVWTKGCNKVLEMDAYFRVVNRMPYMKPLEKQFNDVG